MVIRVLFCLAFAAGLLGGRSFGSPLPVVAVAGVDGGSVQLVLIGGDDSEPGSGPASGGVAWLEFGAARESSSAVGVGAESDGGGGEDGLVPGEGVRMDEPAPAMGTVGSTTAEPNAVPPVVLPVEVLSAYSTSRVVIVSVPFVPVLAGPGEQVFEARIFGLDYAEKATVEINDDFSLTLDNSNVRLPARQAAYGGIGGIYSTLRVQIPLPAGTVRPGRNRIRFVFNGTDGESIGYRVLGFNFLVDGVPLLPADRFEEDDPARWTAPYGDAESIAEGRWLWENRDLVTSTLRDATGMRARCGDCHARDGYDLKYFNFSNLSIIERSKFHGLTEEEGAKVASYVRTLNAPAPGRPWNPPYQPGPGVDSKPIDHWAAGAGIDAVLEDDVDTYDHLFAGGIPQEWDLMRVLNVREIPVALELPVWNLWLPKIHPLDYFGERFTGGRVVAAYRVAAAAPRFAAGLVEAARAWDDYIAQMSIAMNQSYSGSSGLFSEAKEVGAAALRRQSLARYGVLQWRMVKTWEMMRRYELEGLGGRLRDINHYPSPPSPAREVPERTWLRDGFAFRTAPHWALVGSPGHGIRDGTLTTWNYITLAWYYLQLVLDDNHRHGDGAVHWPYMTAFSGLNSRGETFGGLRSVVLFKNMEAYYNNRRPRDGIASAWSFVDVRMNFFSPASPASVGLWDRTPTEIWRPMVESYLRAYLRRTREYSVEEYQASYTPSFTGAGVASLGTHSYSLYWLPQWYWSFRDFKARGIDPLIIDDAVDFAGQLWPDYRDEFEKLRSGAR